MIYLQLIILWGIYFAIHSLLATPKAKQLFAFKYYRLAYNMVATVGLIGIFLFSAVQPLIMMWPKNSLSQIGGLIFATYGILIMRRAFRAYSFKEFAGLQSENPQHQLIQTGILQYVRHPIYTATILLVIGFFLFAPSDLNLISTCCIFTYLGIGIRLEEQKLIAAFGEKYKAYQEKVPMLFPKGMKWMNLLK